MEHLRRSSVVIGAAFFVLLQPLQALGESSNNSDRFRLRVGVLAGYQYVPSFLLKLGGDVQESPSYLGGDIENLLFGLDLNKNYSLYLSLGRTNLSGNGSWRRNVDPRAAFVDGHATGKTTMDVWSLAAGLERRFFLWENRKNLHLFVRLLGGAAMLEGKFRGMFRGVFRDVVPPEIGTPGDPVFEPASDNFRRIIPVVDFSAGIRAGLDTWKGADGRWSLEIAPHVNQLGFGARAGVTYNFDLPF